MAAINKLLRCYRSLTAWLRMDIGQCHRLWLLLNKIAEQIFKTVTRFRAVGYGTVVVRLSIPSKHLFGVPIGTP